MDLGSKYGLLIDDVPEMRTTVRIQLTDAGLERCDLVRNVKEAIDKIGRNRYDLIVCDYNLGQGADGQQLLELVRRQHLLPLTTAFLMITGETAYEQVSTAAEFSPDDYLIKPFTSETLRSRLLRILEKKQALAPIYRHMGARTDSTNALAACDALLADNSRYRLDVLRLKGELLLSAGRPQDALTLYDEVLQSRQTPWAAVGRAQALAASGETAAAQAELSQILTAYPSYLAGYDALVQLLETRDKREAQAVVEQALKVSASTRRQRQLGTLALENQDFEKAESAYRAAVNKDRTGFFKSHDDYAGLAKSCAEQGKTQEALSAVKEMAQHFQRTPELEARQAAVESQVHLKAGNAEAARTALERALKIGRENPLDPHAALELAQACFSGGAPEEAKRIIQTVAEDHHENDQIFARAQSVFSAAGLNEEGQVFLEATRKRMIKLNNDAVALAKAGELDQAIDMLSEAADRLTNNAQVALNAALSLLMRLQKHGPDAQALAKARHYVEQASKANPAHPRLAEVTTFLEQLTRLNAQGAQAPET